MHPCAPGAVRLGIGFTSHAQSGPVDARPRVLGALARGPVFVTPADCQNPPKGITLRVAARTVRPGEVGGVDELATHRCLSPREARSCGRRPPGARARRAEATPTRRT